MRRSKLAILAVAGGPTGASPGGAGPQEVANFDMQPASDATAFHGAWSAIPHLDSGHIVVSTFDQGMFTLSLDESVSRTDCTG